MKKSIFTMFIMTIAFGGVMAQEVEKKDNFPYWTISKEVQRIPYRNVEFTPAQLVTGNASWTVSKRVQSQNVTQPTGRVAKTGTPSWVISKGVARMNYEKSSR